MSDQDKPKLGMRAPLGLTRTVETGKVKQSFSHGRSNTVVVEVKRRRVLSRPGEEQPAEQAAPEPVAAAPAPAPAPGARRRAAPAARAAGCASLVAAGASRAAGASAARGRRSAHGRERGKS